MFPGGGGVASRVAKDELALWRYGYLRSAQAFPRRLYLRLGFERAHEFTSRAVRPAAAAA